MARTLLDSYDVIAIILGSKEEGIMGRTAIHELVYLAQYAVSGLYLPRFRPHYFGPVSPEIDLVIESVIENGFVLETRIPGATHEMYRYEVTFRGEEVVRMLKVKKRKKFNEIMNFMDKCDKFCGLDSVTLSYAAKIIYLVKDQEKSSLKDAIKQARILNKNASNNGIEQGIKLLKKLGIDKLE